MSCYRPANNSNYNDFQTQLLTKLTEVSKTADEVILCGDLNIGVLKNKKQMHLLQIFVTAIISLFISYDNRTNKNNWRHFEPYL